MLLLRLLLLLLLLLLCRRRPLGLRVAGTRDGWMGGGVMLSDWKELKKPSNHDAIHTQAAFNFVRASWVLWHPAHLALPLIISVLPHRESCHISGDKSSTRTECAGCAGCVDSWKDWFHAKSTHAHAWSVLSGLVSEGQK